VLVDGADEALKGIVARVCQAREAEMIELEVMPDHVHLLVDVDPNTVSIASSRRSREQALASCARTSPF
jgi:REP element-mobilizing transposase RayT